MKVTTINQNIIYASDNKTETTANLNEVFVMYNGIAETINFYSSISVQSTDKNLIISVHWNDVENMNSYIEFKNYVKNAEIGLHVNEVENKPPLSKL